MCSYSMVMDYQYDKWTNPSRTFPIPQSDIDDFYELLRRAREYDKKMNQPDCEEQEKKDRLQKLADELNITITFI